MKVYLKEKGGRSFFIPIPLSIAIFGLNFSSFIIGKTKKYISEDALEYIECVDYKILAQNIKLLKKYKGLNLIEVTSADGTFIKVTI